jgi:hypothetical protein
MSTRSIAVLAAAAGLFATCAFANDSAAKAARPLADAACSAERRVYPHPHKGFIVKPSRKAQSACTVAQRKSLDTSI